MENDRTVPPTSVHPEGKGGRRDDIENMGEYQRIREKNIAETRSMIEEMDWCRQQLVVKGQNYSSKRPLFSKANFNDHWNEGVTRDS